VCVCAAGIERRHCQSCAAPAAALMVRLNKRLLLHWCLLQNLQQWFCIIMMTGFDAQRFSMSCYLLPFLLDVVSCRTRPVKSSVTGSTAVGAGLAALTLSQRESCRKP